MSGETDVKYFDKFEEEEPWVPTETQQEGQKQKKARKVNPFTKLLFYEICKKDAHFIGYTYKKDAQ